MPCLRPIDVFNRKARKAFLAPCGKCDECLQRRKMSFVFRCEQEKLHGEFKHCYFITLTYKDSYLPFVSYSEKKFGAPVNPVSTGESLLCPYDLSQFFKRYRLFSEDKIRFFACGEYGSEDNTHRPHFHVVLFCNHDWKTCVSFAQLSWSYLIAETSQDRNARYRLSRKLGRRIKRDPRKMENRDLIGRVQVKSVTYKRICYVAKYCNKILFSSEVVKPFLRLSKGLGESFLESDTAKLCQNQNRHFTYFQNALPVAIPRYYTHRLFNQQQMDEFALKLYIDACPPDELCTCGDSPELRAWYKAKIQSDESKRKRQRLARYGLLKYY